MPEKREERDLVVVVDPVGRLVDMNMQRRRRFPKKKKKKKKEEKNGGWDPLQNEHQRKGR